MARTIYKYPLPLQFTGPFNLDMPKAVDILTVQLLGFKPCIWAIIDKDDIRPGTLHTHKFHVVGTGWDLDDMGECTKYIGTWHNDGFVWHLFGEQ